MKRIIHAELTRRSLLRSSHKDKATYDRGLVISKSVLGNEFVDKAGVDAFRNAREVFAELDKTASGT